MPSPENYKEIFEIGKRLQEIAREAGYKEGASEEEAEGEYEDTSPLAGMAGNKTDKMTMAKALFGKA